MMPYRLAGGDTTWLAPCYHVTHAYRGHTCMKTDTLRHAFKHGRFVRPCKYVHVGYLDVTRRIARRCRLYGILVTAKNRQPIDILYCISGSSYSGWLLAHGFIDGSGQNKASMALPCVRKKHTANFCCVFFQRGSLPRVRDIAHGKVISTRPRSFR